MKAVTKEKRRVAYPLVLVFAILALGIVMGGTFYYRHYEWQFRTGVEDQLSAIADLKVSELVQYRKERLGDAATFFKNAAFSGLVRRFLDHPEDTDAQEQLQSWLDKYQTDYQYDRVFLLDAQGVERMSTPVTAAAVSAVVSRRVAEVLRSREIAFQDFHRNEHNQQIYLTLLVPILDEPDHSQALGVLALRIDPKTYLYPFISRWPTPSRTAETLLVRRDGNDALFLNELKFGTNTALNLRISIENTNVAAVKAVLGEKGIAEGVDYRGIPVVAALSAIPDSPWFLVARMDAAEVYAPLRERLWMIILLVIVLVLCAGAGAGAIWRRQRARFYQERLKVAEALRESEERLRSHTDNSPMAVIEWNADLIITQWTGAAEKIFGWSAEEAIGKPIAELPGIYEEDLPAVQSVIRQLAGGVSKQVFSSNRNRTRNGQVIHCEWYNSVLHDARGKMTSVLSQVLDVTVRQRAEEALRASENRLRTLVQTIPDLVWLKDTNGVFLSCNTAFERLFGAGESSIVGKTDYDFVEKPLADFFRQRDQAAMAADEPTTNEEWLTFAHDGYRGLFQTIKTPMRDADGALVGVLGVARDITGRKRAEEALRESQALYFSLVEQLPVGVFRKDPAGRYVLVNPWFCRLKGMKAEEFLGKTPEEVAASEVAKQDPTGRAVKYAAAGGDHHGQIMQTGKPIELVEEYTDADGRKQFVHALKLPVFDPDGKIIGTQGILSDITEIKQAAETIAHERQLLRTLIDLLPETFYIKDLDSRFLVVNETLAKQFGKDTPSQVLGLSDADLFPAGLAAEFRAEEMKVFAGEPLIDQESTMVSPDGRERTVSTTKLPFRDSQGRICGLVGIGRDITERRQAEEALHHEQTLMATLMKNLPDAIYFKDAASRFLRVNPAMVRWFGLSDPAQIIGKTDTDFFTGEHASKALVDEQEIIRTGQPLVNIEEKETWPNGSETWVLTTKLPLRDDAGRIIGTCGISSNITERKRAEEVLRLSEERLLKVITQTRCILNSGQVEGPENWRERALNPETPFHWDFPVQNEETAQKIFPLELAAGERYQQAWTRSRNHADHTQMNWSSGNALLNDLPFYRNEFRCIDKHGAGHWMQQFVTVRKLAENRWQVFGVTTDISDLKRVEAELRRSETGLQATLESTADGILAVDSKGKVIKANRRFAELWRIPQSLMDAGDDRVLLDFVLKQLSDPDAFLKKVQLLYSTDAVEMDTLAFKDGRIFERYTSPMKMEGVVIGRVWSFRDITERKRQEEELKQKNSELERFTYTVSHDLKSPLVTVNTFLGYLEQDLARPDMERVKQDVAYMHTATKKMGQLLDELLNLARVGRKKNPAVRVTFRELAQEAVWLVAGRISTGGVKVQVADAIVTLEGDRPRLMEIWQNLVENACKFMGNQPQPQVEIGVEQRGSETVFFVRDNGAGIDPRYQEKVFGLFEKLDSKGEGTGMGLALVKRIVELYEGRIWVESPGLGQGANFLFTLPAAVIIETEQSS
jgi:PAS domain S-box-containing protein